MARAIKINRTFEPDKYEMHRQYQEITDAVGKYKRGDIETLGLENMFFAELDNKGATFKDLNKDWPAEKLSDAYLVMLRNFGTLVEFNDRDPRLKKMAKYCNTESKFRLFSYLMLFDRFRPQVTDRKWISRNLVSGISHSSDSSVAAGLESMVSGYLLREFRDPSYGETQAAYFYNMTSTGHQELKDSLADIENLDKPENPTDADLWRGKKYSILLNLYGNKIKDLVRDLRKKKVIQRINGLYEGEVRYHVCGEGKMNVARRVVEDAEMDFVNNLKRRGPPYKVGLVGFK